MTAAYQEITPVIRAVILAAVSLPGTVVTAGDIDRAPCTWCQDVGAVTAIRVHGDPSPHSSTVRPVEMEDCCVGCAPSLVDRALAEQDPRSKHPIRIEVSA